MEGDAAFPKPEIGGNAPPEKPQHLHDIFIYISKIILVWHALTVALVMFGIFCYSENIFNHA